MSIFSFKICIYLFVTLTFSNILRYESVIWRWAQRKMHMVAIGTFVQESGPNHLVAIDVAYIVDAMIDSLCCTKILKP